MLRSPLDNIPSGFDVYRIERIPDVNLSWRILDSTKGSPFAFLGYFELIQSLFGAKVSPLDFFGIVGPLFLNSCFLDTLLYFVIDLNVFTQFLLHLGKKPDYYSDYFLSVSL